MKTVTTTIKREWLCEIVARRKRVEYREIKPYWTKRLAKVKAPFLLQLTDGMQLKAPQVTVVVKQVRKNLRFEIDSLQNTLKWIDIAAMPVIVTLAGLILAYYKRNRRAAQ